MYLNILRKKEHMLFGANAPRVRSKAEARKHGLQHHMGLNARNPDFVACEHQMRRPACASTQSDSTFVIQISLNSLFFGGLQHDKASGYAPAPFFIIFSIVFKTFLKNFLEFFQSCLKIENDVMV